jgi:hypothetical protein
MRDEREEHMRVDCLSFHFIFKVHFLIIKYLENCFPKLRTDFTFEILASRFSKPGPILIGFEKLYMYMQNLYGCTYGLYVTVQGFQ